MRDIEEQITKNIFANIDFMKEELLKVDNEYVDKVQQNIRFYEKLLEGIYVNE